MNASASGERAPGPEMSSVGPAAPAISEMSPGSYHDAYITDFERDALNDNVNIIAYPGMHGGGENDRYRHLAQVEIEFDAAAGVVASLKPERGDVLFVEGEHFDTFRPIDWQTPELCKADPYRVLEIMCRKGNLNTFEYAAQLAALRGIPVVPADMHVDALQAFNEITGQDYAARAIDPTWPYLDIFHSLREEQVANVVKDYGVAQLPDLLARQPNEEKPTYAILWGSDHFVQTRHAPSLGFLASQGVETAFDRLGLRMEYRELPNAAHPRVLAYFATLLRHLPEFPGAPEQLKGKGAIDIPPPENLPKPAPPPGPSPWLAQRSDQ